MAAQPRHRAVRRLLPAALLVGLTLACSAERRPHVVLLVIDSLRADRLHHAGDPRPLSPGLDEFAAAGTRFTQARSAAPWTTPSVMSIFTGLHPSSHHIDQNDRVLDPSVPTLAERFRAAGWATGAVMPALTLSEHFGFDRGFDQFVLEQKGHGATTGPWSVARALDFARQRRDQPFFLYVHFWDPHYNYNPPLPEAARFEAGSPPPAGGRDDVTALLWTENPLSADRLAWIEGQYAAEILFTDEQVSHLLAELERLAPPEDLLVMVTADHGEAFQEHGWLGHTNRIYDELHHVPWIVRWPGRIAAGRVSSSPVSLVDLAPTVLDLAGVRFGADEFEGRSRAALLTGRAEDGAPPEALLLATSRQAQRRGLWTPEWSYLADLVTGRGEYFEHAADPGQRHDLAQLQPARAARAREQLCTRLARAPARGEVPIRLLPADLKAMFDAGLRTLGYLGGGAEAESARRRFRGRLQDPGAERAEALEALDCGTPGGR